MSINMTAGPERASVQKNYVADIVGPLSISESNQIKGAWYLAFSRSQSRDKTCTRRRQTIKII